MVIVTVKVKNINTGEVYFEMEFDQNDGVDYGLGTNIGSQYIPMRQVRHVQLELSGAVVVPTDEQLSLGWA